MDYSDRQVSAYQLDRIEPVKNGWAVTLSAQLYARSGSTAGPTVETTVVVPRSGQSIEEIVSQAVELTQDVNARIADYDTDELIDLAIRG